MNHDDNNNNNQTIVCYIPDRKHLSGDIVSTTRSNLNVNKSILLILSPRANIAGIKGTMLGYWKGALCPFIFFLAHVIFGELEKGKKMDNFIIILTALISLHALQGSTSLLCLNSRNSHFSL